VLNDFLEQIQAGLKNTQRMLFLASYLEDRVERGSNVNLIDSVLRKILQAGALKWFSFFFAFVGVFHRLTRLAEGTAVRNAR